MRHSVAEKPPFPLTLTLSLGARILRTLCAHCAPEPASGPLTPSLSPSEGERVPEGRERGRFMGKVGVGTGAPVRPQGFIARRLA